MLHREVAPGVHRIEHAVVNCYLVEDDDGVTVVDAGLPAVWPHLGRALRAVGRRPSEVRALVLTHAHFDHVGVARRLQARLGVPVWAHEAEKRLVAHPYRYAHESVRGVYPLRYPASIPLLARMAAAGALWVRGTAAGQTLAPGAEVPVPGRPRVVFSPGHTYGHCALHLPDRGALLSGDALVTLDPYTGRTGPRIVAGAATADSAQALSSLDALADTGAAVVLPGHGEPWPDAAAAAAAARAAGPA
ncbi:MBL fold metallo-hydrolase [Georgenia sp. TF02-10]|uniref:MBL fold metallo-hydrolase n=1 Tax=Georgenia sp. TF02-10 TaxID=2917725 RepID=UPI001FA78406|nr:MBL fold metallo-hydrolase [Georgenia sp. TF02-10]UNX54796.1 MBL fold metallo-hydrolase [Georgenia sp. TF02-10]